MSTFFDLCCSVATSLKSRGEVSHTTVLIFYSAGVRGNEEGNYLLPDMPDYPEGYPRQTGFESKKQTQQNKDLEEKTDFDTEKWIGQMIQFMENHDFENEHLEIFEEMFCPKGDCDKVHADPETMIDATDIQVQLNTWRRTEAVPLGKSSLGYRYLLEFHEAPSSQGFTDSGPEPVDRPGI